MVQTKEGAANSDWIAFLRVCGKVWRSSDAPTEEQVRERYSQLAANARVISQLERGELSEPCRETLLLMSDVMEGLVEYADALAVTSHQDQSVLQDALRDGSDALHNLYLLTRPSPPALDSD